MIVDGCPFGSIRVYGVLFKVAEFDVNDMLSLMIALIVLKKV